MHPFPAYRSPPEPGHVRLGAGFIQKHQGVGIERSTSAQPEPARSGYIRPLLFAGTESLFLYVRFMPARA